MSHLKEYEYIAAIARHGGISQAADALQIAQPTLSKFLKKVETDMGVELFDRTTIPIKITRAGELFLESGKRMWDLERQFQKQLAELQENKSTTIRVGISPSRSPYMMPLIIEAYRKKNPTGRIVIEERTTDELNSRLMRGDLDVIITLESEDTRPFSGIRLFEEDVILATPNDPAYVEYTATELLRKVPLINVGKGQAMWQTVNAIAEECGAPTPVIECQSIESGLALVRHGLGAMIVPSYIATFGSREQREKILFVPFSERAHARQAISYTRIVCLFYRKEQFLTRAEKDFIACVQDVLIEK